MEKIPAGALNLFIKPSYILFMCIDFLEKAWKVYRKNILPFTGAMIIILLITALFGLWSYSLLRIRGLNSLSEVNEENLGYVARTVGSTTILEIIGIVIVMSLIIKIISLGIYGMAFEAIKRKTKISTLFRIVKEKWFIFLKIIILMGIIYGLFFTFLIIILSPLLSYSLLIFDVLFFLLLTLFSVFFMLVYPAVVDKNEILNAVRVSIERAKKYYVELFGLLITFIIISIILSFIPILGTIITYFVISPLFIISVVQFYKKNK